MNGTLAYARWKWPSLHGVGYKAQSIEGQRAFVRVEPYALSA